ncbi:2600_t:CDS:2, partial [Dentiscutata heterogama]
MFNVLNSKRNIINDYDNFENFEALIIGESDLFYKTTFKRYDKHVILKPLIVSQRFALKDFIDEFNRYKNVKLHDNILQIFGLTMPDQFNITTNTTQIVGRLNQYFK